LSSFDNLGVNLTSIALVEKGSADVSSYVQAELNSGTPLPYALQQTHKGIYSSYPSGMLVFGLPFFAAGRFVGANLQRFQWRIAKLASAVFAALGLILWFFILKKLTNPKAAAWALVFVSLSSSVFSVTSQGLWTHGGVIFWELLYIYFICYPLKSEVLGSSIRGALWAQMLSCRLTSVAFIIPFACFAWGTSRKRFLIETVAAVAAYLPWAIFYHSTYGSFLGPQTQQGSVFAFDSSQFGHGLLGLVFSPARGFLVYQPWLILILIAVGYQMFRPEVAGQGKSKQELSEIPYLRLALVANIVAQLIGMSFWRDWPGGYSWGSRFLSESLPAISILVAAALAGAMSLRQLRIPGLALLAIGFYFHAFAVLGPGMQWNYCYSSTESKIWFRNQWLVREAPFVPGRCYFGR
jgi:hypothetical protein